MLNQIYKERRKLLAEFLQNKVPPTNFAMKSTGTGDYENHACGSYACIIGWTIVVFPELWQEFCGKHQLGFLCNQADATFIVPVVQEFAGGVLGMSDTEQEALFFDDRIETPQEAAHRLQGLEMIMKED